MANGFNVREDILNLLRSRGIGLPGDGNILTRAYSLWHRISLAAAGVTQQTFFNENKSPDVTNLEQANILPANYVFVMDGMSFNFIPGFDRTGSRVAAVSAASLNYSGTAVGTDATAPVWKWAEKTRELLSQGQVVMTIGDREMINRHGLDAFPSGRGLVASMTVSNSLAAATTASASASLTQAMLLMSNGAPVAGNVYRFSSPIAIPAGQNFGVRVNWGTKVDFTEQYAGPLYNLNPAATVAGTLVCELHGLMVQPANA